MDLQNAYNLVKDFIVKEGDYVHSNWHHMNIVKTADGGADVTTDFDQHVEKAFNEFVLEHFPDCGFRGEEHADYNRDGEYTWHIDPIDGTKFFAAGIPSWVVTIALTKGEEGKLGFIYNPNSQQLYSAIQGEGAYLNNERIELNKELDPAKLQVAIDTFQKFDDEDFYQEILTLNNKLVDTFYRVRALGTGALSLAWLSQGFFGAYVDYARKTSKHIDVVGGLLIASEAGAIEEKWEVADGLYRSIVARPEVVEIIKGLLD